MERTDIPVTEPRPSASQRFAALAGLDWTGPTSEQTAAFGEWLTVGNTAHGEQAGQRVPRAA